MAFLALLAAITSVEGAEVRNIIGEIKGDTGCILRATRTYYTWSDYSDLDEKLQKRSIDPNDATMQRYADRNRRTSWRNPAYQPRRVDVQFGDVTGAQRTRWGSIFRNEQTGEHADIAVGYQLDWRITGEIGWMSDHEPCVMSVTEIVIKPEFAATVEFVNNYKLFATGFISGTAGARNPWPQQGKHDATLVAVDICGNQHELHVAARATAMATETNGASDSTSSTNKWIKKVGINASGEGVSGSVEVTNETSQTVTTSEESSSSVPRVGDVKYTKRSQGQAKKTVELPCGGSTKVSRKAMIDGHFLTRSFAPHGSVSTNATHSVGNYLEITVTCKRCGGSPDPVGEPSDPPGGDPDPSNPTTNPKPSGGTQSTKPKPRNGVTITPRFGDTSDPGAWWDNPIIRNGGCIYIDPRYLPSFIEPVDESSLLDPNFELDLDESKIPLVVPEDVEGDEPSRVLVPLGYLMEDAVIVPAEGTTTSVNPETRMLTITGPFSVRHPDFTEQDVYPHGALIEISDPTAVTIDGPFEFEGGEPPFKRLPDDRYRLYLIDEENTQRLPDGPLVQDEQQPGSLQFTDSPNSWGPRRDLVEGLWVKTTSVRRTGRNLEIDYEVDWNDIPFRVERSKDLVKWRDAAIWEPEGGNAAPETFELIYPISARKPQEFFRVRILPSDLSGLEPLTEADFPFFAESYPLHLQEMVHSIFELTRSLSELEFDLETGPELDAETWAARQIEGEQLARELRQRKRELDSVTEPVDPELDPGPLPPLP